MSPLINRWKLISWCSYHLEEVGESLEPTQLRDEMQVIFLCLNWFWESQRFVGELQTPILPFLLCQFINQKQRLQAQSRVIASNVRRFYRRALQELNVDPRRNDGTWKCWQKIWWIVNNHFADAKRQVWGQEDVVKIFGTKGGECLFWKAAEDDLWIEKWNRTFHLGPGKQLCIKNWPGQAFVRVMEAWVSKKRKKDVQAFKRSIFIH